MRTIVTLFVAVFVAFGAVFLAPAVEGQVTAPVEVYKWDLEPGRAWTDHSTGAKRSMISYACTATDRTYEWAPGESSLLTLHVKVMARGQSGNTADYHSRSRTGRYGTPQPQQCDLRKGIDVVTFEVRNEGGVSGLLRLVTAPVSKRMDRRACLPE